MPSAVIGALRVNLSADTAEFRRNLTSAEAIANKFGNSLGSSIKKQILAFGAAAAVAAGPAALGLLLKSSIENVSAQVDLARRVGASVAAIQTLQEAAKLSGASQEALSSALGKLNAKLGEVAQKGAGPAYEALQRLGLSARELSEMDADERVKTLSDRMIELGYSSQQTSATLKTLGIKNQEITNLFLEGSAAIDRTRQELVDFGVILSDVDAGKIEEVGDAFDKLKLIAVGLGNQIAAEFAPDMLKFAEAMGIAAKQGTLTTTVIGFLRGELTGLTKAWIQSSTEVQVFMRYMQEADEILGALMGGREGDSFFHVPDLEAAKEAHRTATKDIEKLWIDMGNRLADLQMPSPLLKGVDEYIAKLRAAREEAKVQAQEKTEADAKEEARLAKELEKYNAHLQSKLASLQESLLTETEAENAQYDQRMADLEDFHARGLISDAEYRAALIRNGEMHQEALKEINDGVIKNQESEAKKLRATYYSIADNITSALSSLFGDNKAWAIAEALINTAVAITKALAEYGPTPQGWAMVAAAAAAGVAQIAAIRKQTMKGGGGGGAPTVSRPSATAATGGAGGGAEVGTQQTLFISGLNPKDLYSGEAVRALAAKLIEFQRDGGRVVLAPA
jgi:hypothetical protein